jgi:hypothetical protein
MKYILCCLALIMTTSVYAQEKADKSTVNEMIEYCQEIAAEEGTGEQSVDEFLLTCVNQELASEGYQVLQELPKS